MPPIREHVKVLLSKCTVLNVDLLQDHQIYRLQACMYARFRAEGVKTAHYILVTISGTGRTTPHQLQGIQGYYSPMTFKYTENILRCVSVCLGDSALTNSLDKTLQNSNVFKSDQ